MYMYKNGGETTIYYHYNRLLQFFVSVQGKNWIELSLATRLWIIHAMIMEFQALWLAFWTTMTVNNDLVPKMPGKNNIPDKGTLSTSIAAAQNIYNNICVSATGGAGSNFSVSPLTYKYNTIEKPIGTKRHQQNPQQQSRIASTNQNNNNDRSLKIKKGEDGRKISQNATKELTQGQIDKFEKQRFLKCKNTNAPRLLHVFKTHNNKELCKGFCFEGKYCSNTAEDCSKAHIPGFNNLLNTDKTVVEDWVQKQKGDVSFVLGRGPKKSGK